jgi:hypothetical protein
VVNVLSGVDGKDRESVLSPPPTHEAHIRGKRSKEQDGCK